MRATTTPGFEPLQEILGFKTPQQMLEHINSEQMMRIWQDRTIGRNLFIDEVFNLDTLKRVWSDQRR